jgi:hypothetical protein
MIKLFKDFEFNMYEKRGYTVSDAEFDSYINGLTWNKKEHAPSFFRRKNYLDNAHKLVDPKEQKRDKVHNSYVIEKLKLWKDYPSRSKSIIMVGGPAFYVSSTFGKHVYKLYPSNGAKIAICPTNDFNLSGSFKYLESKTGIEYAFDFTKAILELVPAINKHKKTDTDKHYSDFKDFYDSKSFYEDLTWALNYYKDTDKLEYDIARIFHNEVKGLIHVLSQYRNAEEMVEDLLSPDKNGFKLADIGELTYSDCEDKECWTSDKVAIEYFNDFVFSKVDTREIVL